MSDGPVKVQPPSDKQPVIDVNTGNWTKYGQRQQWDMWKRIGGFTDDVWEALIAGLIGSTQFSAIFNQFEAMQTELAELRTELAARQSYDDQIEELRIQLASVQQISENIVQQQESTRQEIEAREELQVARQAAVNGGFETRQYASIQAIADTDQTISNLTTSNIPEGSRLYYTDARARLAISSSGDIGYNSATGAIGALATVNANVGSFGGASAVPNFTVNGKGLITAAGSTAVIAPAGTLTGTTLAATVTTSSLTSVGTLTSLAVAGTFAATQASASTVYGRFVNTNTGSGSSVALSLDPTNNGPNVRDAVIRATTDGGNAVTLDFLTCNAGPTAVGLSIAPNGLVTLPLGLAVGTYTATPGVITGYITIKDAGGTNRRIAVTT